MGIDRRQARTRKAILSALEAMSRSGSLDDLTISSLAEAADINRVTFYAHFKSIAEVVDAAVTSILAEAADSMMEPVADPALREQGLANIGSFVLTLSAHMATIKWVGASRYSGRFGQLLKDSLAAIVNERISKLDYHCPERRYSLYIDYLASGLTGLVLRLIHEGLDAKLTEEVKRLIVDLFTMSAYEILGLR